MKKMRLRTYLLALAISCSVLLASCASDNLNAPCPEYGKNCDSTPVNNWDTTTV